MSSRRWLLLAGSALTLAVYGLRLNRVAGLYVDDAWYVLLGQAIASGQGYHLINAPTPAMAAILPAFPPGFPLALALVTTLTSAFPTNVLYLKLVSVVAMFGVGALAAAYYRHRGVPASFASGLALAVVLTPAFVWLATSTVMSEPLFTLALLGAVVLVATQRPVWGGGTAAVAALIRSAGLPIIAATDTLFRSSRLAGYDGLTRKTSERSAGNPGGYTGERTCSPAEPMSLGPSPSAIAFARTAYHASSPINPAT
jgi:hypothetical protein